MAASKHLSIRCPHCHFRFKVDRKFSGRSTRCPVAECQGKLRIPQAASPASQPESAAGSGRDSQTEDHICAEDHRPSARRTKKNSSASAKPKPRVKPVAESEVDPDARNQLSGSHSSGVRAKKVQSREPGRISKQKRPPAGRGIGEGIRIWQVAAGAGGVLAAVLVVAFAPGGGDAPVTDELVAGETRIWGLLPPPPKRKPRRSRTTSCCRV